MDIDTARKLLVKEEKSVFLSPLENALVTLVLLNDARNNYLQNKLDRLESRLNHLNNTFGASGD